MAAAPPSVDALAGKAGELKHVEAKEGGCGVAPEVVELYKKTFAEHGGNKAAVCAALGLETSIKDEYFTSEAKFLAKTLGVSA
eukprot:CAMPEP_0197878948 /NCGR_PEP_ID=MMETSP1439-20131203/7188_1 /TAXON_ID=66791 /ORGANISM="Gonyaulax spinifera, Strain CCMP409" /LENGTH=82 /DNA_ID=CAMNT_0043498415 /DNA_START=80 /DNA_END=328 /DNA_ORIENTATION=-